MNHPTYTSVDDLQAQTTLREAAAKCGVTLEVHGTGRQVRLDCPFGCSGDHAEDTARRRVSVAAGDQILGGLGVGECDALNVKIELDDLDEVAKVPGVVVEQHRVPRLIHLYMRQDGAFKDVRVRKAMAHAFDYDAFIKGVWKGRAAKPLSPLPSAIWSFEAQPEIKQDLNLAKKLLAEAGYAQGVFHGEYLYPFFLRLVPAPGSPDPAGQPKGARHHSHDPRLPGRSGLLRGDWHGRQGPGHLLLERQQQHQRSRGALEARALRPPMVHAANSAGLAFLRPGHTVARPGLLLYGVRPRPLCPEVAVEPVMTVSARIARLVEVPAGTAVSYGGRWVAGRPSRIATLPLGYADGVPRTDAMRQRGAFVVRGRRAPVVGTVCMDLCLADVTDIPGAAVGDEVVLLGRRGGEQITADELAAHAGTISYEIFCGVGPRVPRLYPRGAAEYDGRAATAPGAGQG